MEYKATISEDVEINIMLLQGLCLFMVLIVIIFFYCVFYKLWNK